MIIITWLLRYFGWFLISQMIWSLKFHFIESIELSILPGDSCGNRVHLSSTFIYTFPMKKLRLSRQDHFSFVWSDFNFHFTFTHYLFKIDVKNWRHLFRLYEREFHICRIKVSIQHFNEKWIFRNAAATRRDDSAQITFCFEKNHCQNKY